MKPLLYLWFRSFFNGVKRAVSSPRRLIGIIFFFGYYYVFFVRGIGGSSRPSRRGSTRTLVESMSAFPAPPVVDALVFGLFAFMSIFLAMSLLQYRGGFRPADVETLFPTPVSPKIVMLFRFFRDYVLTLLLPILFAVFAFAGIREGYMPLRAKNIAQAALVERSAMTAWIMLALAWTTLGYAASLFVARTDTKSERITKIGTWTLVLGITTAFATVLYWFVRDPSSETALAIATHPAIRALCFLPTLATWLAAAPITGNWALGGAGFGLLLLLIVASATFAFSQAGWLYDQASSKGLKNSNVRELQKKGDMMGIYAEYARQGKLKQGRLAAWLSRWRVQGPLALIYKELLVFARTGYGTMIVALLIFVGVGVGILFMPERSRSGRPLTQIIGPFYLGFTSLMVYSFTVSQAVVGFTDSLKRVDLSKPLPFTSTITVFYEVVAKAVPYALASMSPYLIGLFVKPSLWQYSVSGLILAPLVALLVSSAAFLVLVMFPDFDDPTQRGFRGMILMLGSAIVLTPTVGAIAAAVFYKVLPLLPTLPLIPVNLGISILLCTVAGRLYADFNPSE